MLLFRVGEMLHPLKLLGQIHFLSRSRTWMGYLFYGCGIQPVEEHLL
jgi:hypothetical protein